VTTLPSQAQVVIVGGGILGCSTAYHLARAGYKDVLVLEQGKLAGGTTWHAAGLVGQLRPNRSMTSMSRYGVALYKTLEQETGLATGWKACGSLYVAQRESRLQWMRQQATLARRFGVLCEEVSPREAADLFPVMRHDDLVGALWLPEDGKVNPYDLCMSLARGARQAGVRIVENARVSAVLSKTQGRRRSVCGVRVGLSDGEQEIVCEVLVNCAGQWARQFAALAQVNVPLYAAEHFYIVTDVIPGIDAMLPVMRDPDGYIYYKEEVGGLLMGGFEPRAKPWQADPIPDDFQFQLLNEDWDQFEVLMKSALHRTPCLETAGVKMLLNGPESFTPDGNFIMGEAPECHQYFVCAGFNSSGIANSAGAGRLMAEWIMGGEASVDLSDVDIRRFSAFSVNRKALAARTVESLGLHYAMRWPRYELQSARPLRTSPLYDLLAAKGAVFGSKHGWECVNYFSTLGSAGPAPSLDKPAWLSRVKMEQRAACEAVAIIDQSALSKILVQGRDALSLLQRLCSSDIDLPPDGRCETLLLNARGGIESLLSVIRVESDVFMLVTSVSQAVRDMHWIGRHQHDAEQLVLTDVSAMFSVLSVLGPAAGRLLAHLSSGDFSAEAFDLSATKLIDLGFARPRAAAIHDGLHAGFDLYVPVEMTRHVYLAIHEAGAALGLLDAGHYALDALRIEAGRCTWGAELGPEDGPWEAGLQRLINLDQSHFIGREALVEAVDRPVRKRLVKLVCQDPEAYAWGGETIIVDAGGQEFAGDIRSAGWGFEADRCVALGYVYGELASMVHRARPAKALIWGKPSPVLLYSL